MKALILAGQSNREGHGQIPSLHHLGNPPKYGHLLKLLKNADGSWVVRHDVTISHRVQILSERKYLHLLDLRCHLTKALANGPPVHYPLRATRWNLRLAMVTYLAYCLDQEFWKAIEYLKEQVRVLKEQQEKDKRILLDNLQRTRLATHAKRLTRELLEATTVLFTPETVLGWYRRLIAQKYDGSKNRKTPGRPRISQEVIDRKRPAEYAHESRTNMTQRIGEQVDNRGESSDTRLVKSGSKTLARPLRRSFGDQFAVGGCRTEVVGFADPAAGCHTGTRKGRRRSRSLSNGKCRVIITEPARVDLSFRLRQAEGGRIDSDIRDGISSTAQGGCRP